jgi:hypothetical protein
MDRRRFLRRASLAGVGATGLGLAGCLAPPASTAGAACPGPAPSPEAAATAPTSQLSGSVDLPVDQAELVQGALRDEIPAITDPAFGSDWGGVDGSLRAEDLVVGVVRDGAARAYPLATLSTYEVVNDSLGGPLMVTYCPLCASAVTAVREVGGEATTFGVSGKLYRSNLVLYDQQTGTLWSQILAQAISGPATGETLSLVPSTLTTWTDWRRDHPETAVLLPPPASGTIARDPRGDTQGIHGHVGVQSVGLDFDDDRLPRTALVLGVATAAAATAYPRDRIADAVLVNDCVGGLPVLVAGDTLPRAFDRRVDGRSLRFARAGPGRMRGGGSTWSTSTGRAVAGPHEGKSLRRLTGATTMYWFSWVSHRPETAVYSR